MSLKYNDELISKIKRQNQQFLDHDSKVVKSYFIFVRIINIINNNKIIYNDKIIGNKKTYTRIKTTQKLNIGWEKCRVSDGTNINMYFKCLGYNH